MGLGDGDNSTEDNFDGSRSAKSYELVKLLQVVKGMVTLKLKLETIH